MISFTSVVSNFSLLLTIESLLMLNLRTSSFRACYHRLLKYPEFQLLFLAMIFPRNLELCNLTLNDLVGYILLGTLRHLRRLGSK